MPTPQELIARLDSRHDELIHKLDELNVQIEQALAEFSKSRGVAEVAVAMATDAIAVRSAA